MRKLIIVERSRDFLIPLAGAELVSARDYLTNPAFAGLERARVFNLCRDYGYQSKGYYVSLLAEARGHKVLPKVKNIQDLKTPAIVRSVSSELDELIQRSLRKTQGAGFELDICFGRDLYGRHARLCRELHRLFPAPFLRASFAKNGKWSLRHLKAISLGELSPVGLPSLQRSAAEYFNKQRYHSYRPAARRLGLAILVDPGEKEPPSDAKAVHRFAEAAKANGFDPQIVTRRDYGRIGEFDALFIRETTSVNHHSYAFARRAESEGLAVIDDPDSILRCTNKVYLAELLAGARIPMPATAILHGPDLERVKKELGLPCILKSPDSAFSHGVLKAADEAELKEKLARLLQRSELVLAQAYLPTEFDWRIGVLDKRPLFACKYYMAKGHWQIYNWNSVTERLGRFETLPLERVPPAVLETALKAANLVGSGLYGVDLKEYAGKPYVIEINDNPNIDAGIEDQLAKDGLYQAVILSLKRRIGHELSLPAV